MTRYASIFLILLITLLSGTVLAVMTDPDGSMPHVAIRQDTGQTKTHHYDQAGSTLLRTGDSGKEIGKAEYSAYGICYLREGDMSTPFLYNGQWGVQTDPNGLLNMRARYYSPYLMRFLNADPSGFSGGMNWYAYADGNPISLNDPFGLEALSKYVSPYDSDGSLNWTGISQYLLEAALQVPDYLADNGWSSFKSNISDPQFVATSALSGMGMGGITGGLRGATASEATMLRAANSGARANFSVYETLAEVPISGVTRGGHRGAANTAFARQLEGSVELQGRFNQVFGKNVLDHMNSGAGSKLLNPPGAVWHHPIENSNVLQLLRKGEHTNPLLQPILHPGPNRTGGFGTHFGGN